MNVRGALEILEQAGLLAEAADAELEGDEFVALLATLIAEFPGGIPEEKLAALFHAYMGLRARRN